MPSFILRNLDADFWGRVQAKAKAEGTTVKSLILRLLASWLGVALIAVLSAACNAMQDSPVAPSVVAPAGTPTPGLPRFTAFDVRLANGTTYAIADSPWLGILSVLPHEGALITIPSQVTADCGNGTVITLPAGIGSDIRFTCRWATSGDVVVRAVVVAQDGVTTRAELPLHVEPPIVVPQFVTVELAVAHDAVVDHQQAWTFTPTTTGRVVNLRWDFGDGQTLTTGPNQAITHWYRANGVYTITAIPVLENGSTRPGAYQQIVVDGL